MLRVVRRCFVFLLHALDAADRSEPFILYGAHRGWKARANHLLSAHGRTGGERSAIASAGRQRVRRLCAGLLDYYLPPGTSWDLLGPPTS